QDKIFEPYFQVGHLKKNSQGLGMGLSIVKKTIESLQGSLKLKSQHRAGTEITIHLPNRQPICKFQQDVKVDEQIHLKIITHVPQDSFHHPEAPYVLVVEDNLSMLNYLVNKL